LVSGVYTLFYFMNYLKLFLSAGLLAAFSCKKENKDDLIIPNNQIPYYDEIQTVVIENYVTRIFIDLLGRDPLQEELDEHTNRLIETDLDTAIRAGIVTKLQTDSFFREEEISYKHQYYQRFYDLNKGRFIEGASEAEINREIDLLAGQLQRDTATGDSVAAQITRAALQNYYNMTGSKDNLREGRIKYNDMCRYMINNGIFDLINMNTFNFINASYQDLFFRFPTQHEYDNAFDAIEKNNSVLLFGEAISNKAEYLELVTTNRPFYEGMVMWMYQILYARKPRPDELYNWTSYLQDGGDLRFFQKELMIADEYAFFITLN